MRKFLWILLGLLTVAVVGVVVVLMTLDLNAYKSEIEAELEAVTGRDVIIAGDIGITFIPTLAISIEDVRVAGVAGGTGKPFLELPDVLAVVALAPLASLDIVVERIRLIEPVVVLETGPDGEASWDIGPGSDGESQTGAPPAIKIELVDLQDARLIVRDGDTLRRFDNVDLWIEALGPDGPFEAYGQFSHLGRAWTADVDIGRFTRPQLAMNLTLASGDDAVAKLAGTMATTGGGRGFSGQIEADFASLGFLGKLIGLPPMPDPLRGAPFSLGARARVSAQAIRLDDLSVSLGESSATGNAVVGLAQGVDVDLDLSVGKLDVDAILTAAAMAETGAAETFEGEGTPAPWPDDVSLSAALSIDAAIYRDAPVRQITLGVVLDEGVWNLTQAKAQLPGGTSLAMGGSLAMEEGTPTFRGPVEIASDNLRATLEWLGIATGPVPRDRLRRVDFFADVTVSSDVVAMTELDLSFDSSRLTGGIAAKIQAVPALAVDVALDQLNLDAYVLPGEAGETDGEKPLSLALGPYAAYLSLLDLDLKARVDALTYDGVLVSGLQADGALLDGRLVLRSLGAGDVAGAALRMSGEIDPGEGSVALQLGAEAGDAGGLLRLMGVELPIDPAELGAVELVGDIDGNDDRVVIRQRLRTGLGAASIDGTLIEPFGDPTFDGRVGLQSGSYRTLAGALGMELPDVADSPISLAADIVTDGNETDFEAMLDVLDVGLRGSGSVADIESQPVFDLRLQADHGDLAGLLEDLGIDDGFADPGHLSVSLVATGSADLIDVVLARSTIGRSDLRGTLGLYLSEGRPRIEARLEAGEVALDPFLAIASGGTPGDAVATQEVSEDTPRWSHGEFDLGVLNDVDAHVELVAEKALFQGLAFQRPVVVADLADGRLAIERLDGELFGGRVAMTGFIADGSPHAIALDVALANADMEQVLTHFAGSDAIAGRLYLDFTVEGQGLSQRDIVQSLAGEGSVTLRRGILRGIDLRRINDRLGELDGGIAIAALLAEASAGGETAIIAADGAFLASDGVVRSDDLRVLLDGAQADFVLSADLPRWWIDMEGEARLTGHAVAPVLPIAVHGPIDGPERVVDTRFLENFLVQRAAETALRNLAGDAPDGAVGTLPDAPIGEETDAGTVADDTAPEEEIAEQPAGEAVEDEPIVVPPLVEVPVKPEPPEATPQTVFDVRDNTRESGESGESAGTGSGGGLLDLLGGLSKDDAAQPGEPEAGADQPAGDGLDTESLLQDLLGDFGN